MARLNEDVLADLGVSMERFQDLLERDTDSPIGHIERTHVVPTRRPSTWLIACAHGNLGATGH
jgi:hypothetical protein